MNMYIRVYITIMLYNQIYVRLRGGLLFYIYEYILKQIYRYKYINIFAYKYKYIDVYLYINIYKHKYITIYS